VKLSTLVEIIGSGSVLLVVGIGILLLGVGHGFTEATHVPLWASLCGLGVLTAVVGGALIDRGSTEAEVQVAKQLPGVMGVIRSPWWTVGAAVVGGFIIQRLLRGNRDIVVENIMPVPTPDADNMVSTPDPDQTKHAKPKDGSGFSISEYVGDQLRSVGSIASGMAISFALRSLGVPTAKELITQLLVGAEKKSEPERPEYETGEGLPTYYDGSTTGGSRMAASHNGHNGDF